MHAEHSDSGAGPAALSTIKTSESSDDEDPLYHDVLYYKGGMLLAVREREELRDKSINYMCCCYYSL